MLSRSSSQTTCTGIPKGNFLGPENFLCDTGCLRSLELKYRDKQEIVPNYVGMKRYFETLVFEITLSQLYL